MAEERSYLVSCLLKGGKGAVALLPQELPRTQERLWVFELPALQGERKQPVSRGHAVVFISNFTEWIIKIITVIQNTSETAFMVKGKKAISPEERWQTKHMSPTTTLHHWLSLTGRSLWDCTHFAYAGYITENEENRDLYDLISSWRLTKVKLTT